MCTCAGICTLTSFPVADTDTTGVRQAHSMGRAPVAFNSPIGGLLFTVEEGASFYSRSSFWRAFLATTQGGNPSPQI